jgi:hypothetical protein
MLWNDWHPGSIPGHSLGFFWGSWVWNGVHSASWFDKLSSYLNKEVTVRFGKLKMQLWDSMCWPHVNPVPSGAVGKDCQRRLLSRRRLVRAVAPRINNVIPTYFNRSRFDPRQGQRIFPLASVSRPALGPTQPPVQWVPGVLSPGVKRGRGVMLTTHPHLVPRSWMSRSYTSSPPKRLHGV